jgi:hypothetical protein
MGGPGSGNFNHWWRGTKKTVVEDCLKLDVNLLTREKVLAPGVHQAGSWGVARTATDKPISPIVREVCTLDLADPWLRLQYNFGASLELLDYRVRLTTTRPHLGGLRWWFNCPLIVSGRPCGRRVGKLYLPLWGNYFGCRHCHELTYTSCQESHQFGLVYRLLAVQSGRTPAEERRIMKYLFKRGI